MKIFHFLLTCLLAMNFLQANAQCNVAGSHYTASYPTGWILTDMADGTAAQSNSCYDYKNGTISGNGTAASFITARDGRELRLSRDIPAVSDQSWTMDFLLRVTAPPAGGLPNNSPSVILASLSTNQLPIRISCPTTSSDPFCNTCANGYPNSNMDAMWVSLESNIPTTTCADNQSNKNWRILAYARDGNGTPLTSTPISIPSGTVGDYYIRLQRTSTTTAMIGVYSNSNYSTHLVGSPQCLTIPGTVSNLHVLSHEVHAQGSCQRIFNGKVDNLKIDNGVPCPYSSLSPSFTMPAYVCPGGVVTLNGSASNGSALGISNHYWSVQECDGFGNNPTGPLWTGPLTNGAPGSYTLPSASLAAAGLSMNCDKYYKVSLTVSSCGNPGVTTSQVLFVSCPHLTVSQDITICQGESTTLDVRFRGTAFIEWLTDSDVIYNGPLASVVVTPATTTTYYLTLYDNATGCMNTAQVTVSVIPNDPSFNLTVNTSDPNYFTISMVANDLNGNSIPGFFFGLSVEELDGAGNPYYGFWGSDCQWSYPNPETYLGFVSTGTGTFIPCPSQPNCGTTPGHFLYNHTYRFTRGVQNNYCSYRQSSLLVTPVKSGNGYAIEIMEDKNAPDMSAQLMTHYSPGMPDNITISPNPSTGIFTIELEEGTDGSLIEVTNALGQKVKSFEAKGERSELDLKGYTKGIYIVTIVSNGSTTTKKIILE